MAVLTALRKTDAVREDARRVEEATGLSAERVAGFDMPVFVEGKWAVAELEVAAAVVADALEAVW